MVARRSIFLIIVSTVQTFFWLPYLCMLPWTLPTPFRTGRWVIWFPGTFDLGTAVDFFPAVVMVVAGSLAVAVGFRRHLTARLINIVLALEVLAMATWVLMHILGWLGSVVFGIYWHLLPFQFVPPATSILIMKRRKRMIESEAPNPTLQATAAEPRG